MSAKDKVGSVIRTNIIDLAYDGQSVGELDGKIIFLNGGLPGEQVEAVITRRKSRYLIGRVKNIISRCDDRIQPSCAHFEICGGCTWQDLDYDKQIYYKRKQIIDSLAHIGKIDNVDVAETIASVDRFYYRNKMEFSFNRTDEENFNLGLHHRGRYDAIFDIVDCRLQSEKSNEIVKYVRDYVKKHNLSVGNVSEHEGLLRFLVIREGKNSGQIMLNIVTRNDINSDIGPLASDIVAKFPEISTIVQNINEKKSNIAYGESEIILFGPGYIEEKILDKIFRIYANSFFQTNSRQAEILYQQIFYFLQPQKSDKLLDLYCGTGTIGICAANQVNDVLGIDSEEAAITAAWENARVNKIANIRFITGQMREMLRMRPEDFADYNCAVLDPPRAGIHPKALKQIIALDLEKIVYVSCNPTTFARDAASIKEAGYEINHVVPVDMFPHTMHIELVGGFYRSI